MYAAEESKVIPFGRQMPARTLPAEVIEFRRATPPASQEDGYVELNRHFVAVLGGVFFAIAGLLTGAWLQI